MPGGNLVAVDYVGGEQVLSETHASMRVVFHDFLAMILPHDRDQFTAMVTNGDLNFTPWRHDQSSEDEVYLSLFLGASQRKGMMTAKCRRSSQYG
jgi:hypothetical protein